MSSLIHYLAGARVDSGWPGATLADSYLLVRTNMASKLKLQCYACGGVGHPSEACAYRHRMYQVAGKTKHARSIVNQALSVHKLAK